MTSIDVSVIVPAWKAMDFIERSVKSALASTGVSLEVIVVDDASPDATFDAIKRLAAADSRVIADKLPVNGGPSAARNRALGLAKGRYIAILDADDGITAGRLASLVTLADSSGADIVADNMMEVDEGGWALGKRQPFLKSADFTSKRGIDLTTWVEHNHPMKSDECLGYLKPLFRRLKLIETELRYDETLRNSEDYYLVANLLAAGGRMIYAPEPGYLYQRSSGSTSHRLQPAHTATWLDAERRFRAQHEAKLSAEEKGALNVRGRALRDVHQFVAAVDAMKSKRIGAFFGLLASDLRASAFTLTAFAKIAMGKALRRKLV